MNQNPITAAFSKAATDLSLDFLPSFSVKLADETLIQSLGLVRGFGNPTGALLFDKSESPARNERKELVKMGYFITVLYSGYDTFDRQHFMETLNDWRYFGSKDARPEWVEDKPKEETDD